MCGLVGYFDRASESTRDGVLERMMDRIAHRGPDARGVHVDGPLGFGHVRLSILDLDARANQPFTTPDGIGVLVYNGEAYNYRALRRELEEEGRSFHTTSDTEVVLQALHHWGPARAVPRLNGMFALAYFDGRDRTLWLARDRLGIKPLYVARTGRTLVFASEMKAVLAHPAVPCRADMHAITTHVLHRYLEGSWTPFQGIEALLPGTMWRVAADDTKEITYFDPVRDFDVARLTAATGRTPRDVIADFDAALRDSVVAHLASDAPVAVFCSGGVDSALVTSIVRDAKPDVIAHVASVAGAFPHADEALKVGNHLGVSVRRTDVDRDSYLRAWPRTVWHNDQPACQPNDVPFMALAETCRREGIKVVLTGEGADELFGGYGWYEDAFLANRQGRWMTLRRLLQPVAPAVQWLANVLHAGVPPLEPLPFAGDVPPFPREESDRRLRYACAVDSAQGATRRRALFEKLASIGSPEERAFLALSIDDLYRHLVTLLHRNDRMGMAASIECRVPFLENRLIDFGMHLPVRFKYRDGVRKWVLKSAAEPRLPREIVHARKRGFETNPEVWRCGLPLVEQGLVPELFKWSRTQRQSLLIEIASEARVAYMIVGIELWARLYLEGTSMDELGEALVKGVQEHISP